jgi:hypothetical protein
MDWMAQEQERGITIVHFSNLMVHPGIIKNALSGRSFTSVNVRSNAYVPGEF